LAAIYGRERELDVGDGFLRSIGDGIKLLRLEGEAGIGKTTVWRELARRAEQLGFRVLSCQPAETEAKLALSALADLLDPVPSKAFVPLPLPQRRALEIALLRSEPDPVAPDFRTLATAVRSLLAHMSVAGPLLVAIDDVQWLDQLRRWFSRLRCGAWRKARLPCCSRSGDPGQPASPMMALSRPGR
jgi:predicted ATPase